MVLKSLSCLAASRVLQAHPFLPLGSNLAVLICRISKAGSMLLKGLCIMERKEVAVSTFSFQLSHQRLKNALQGCLLFFNLEISETNAN